MQFSFQATADAPTDTEESEDGELDNLSVSSSTLSNKDEEDRMNPVLAKEMQVDHYEGNMMQMWIFRSYCPCTRKQGNVMILKLST